MEDVDDPKRDDSEIERRIAMRNRLPTANGSYFSFYNDADVRRVMVDYWPSTPPGLSLVGLRNMGFNNTRHCDHCGIYHCIRTFEQSHTV